MPERRNRENPQNQFAKNGQLKLTTVKYSYRADDSNRARSKHSPANGEIKKKEIHSVKDLFGYNVDLIFKDLEKTLFITAFIIILLIAITWYLKR